MLSTQMLPRVTRVPGISSFIRLMQRKNVDLPQPDGPMNAMTELRATSMLTSLMACFSL